MRALVSGLGAVAGALVIHPGSVTGCGGVPGGIALGWGTRVVQPTPDAGDGAPALWGEIAASDLALRCFARPVSRTPQRADGS